MRIGKQRIEPANPRSAPANGPIASALAKLRAEFPDGGLYMVNGRWAWVFEFNEQLNAGVVHPDGTIAPTVIQLPPGAVEASERAEVDAILSRLLS